MLIKDNHIVAAGGIAAAIERARARAPHTSRIEVEVASLAELDEALAARRRHRHARQLLARGRARGRAPRARARRARGRSSRSRAASRSSASRELAAAGVDVISVRRADPLGAGRRHRARPHAVSDLTRGRDRARPRPPRHPRWGRPALGRSPITASTNDDARAAAAAGAPARGRVRRRRADRRAAGGAATRGTRPPGENLYLSLRPPRRASRRASVAPVTLAVGVAVARVVEAHLSRARAVWVKWPNDVLAGRPGRSSPACSSRASSAATRSRASSSASGVNVRAASFPRRDRGARDLARPARVRGGSTGARSRRALLAAIGDGGGAVRGRTGWRASAADLARLDALRGRGSRWGACAGWRRGSTAEGRLLVRGEGGGRRGGVGGGSGFLITARG